MLKKIYEELVVIRKELQTIRSSLEHRRLKMDEAEIKYRSLTEKERREAGGYHRWKRTQKA